MTESAPSRYLMYKWFFFRNLPRSLSPMFHLESKHISIYFMWAPLQNEVGLTFFLFIFFQSHLSFCVLLEDSLFHFPTWHWFSNWFFLVVSKDIRLKSPRGVGYLTGKTPVMWRSCFSFSVSRNQFFWGFQRKKYRAASTSCPWGICSPSLPLQTSACASISWRSCQKSFRTDCEGLKYSPW